VGRVLTRLPFRQSLVGRVLTRRSFADIKIKSFRAVTARATFLCLCKETWRNESTPRPARPVLCTGSAEPAGFSQEASCLRGKRRTSMCGAPAGSDPPPPPLRRGPERQKPEIKSHGNGNQPPAP